MSCQESSNKNKVASKIKGQTHPFVDENLQLHLPGNDPCDTLMPTAPIHIHILRTVPTCNDNALEEYEQLFSEAKDSFERWQQLHDRIEGEYKSEKRR